ncbi:DUF945 family protein [Pleionea sediminis]|uniref:DUF945 family protein n=1 Tax=Pleionea sediminis TaxID=2569479 RepID=UPI001186119D|nr:DUF945 family protein [Pleionea sediminis]
MKKLLIALGILIVVYLGAFIFIKSTSGDLMAQEIEQMKKYQLSAEVVSEESGLFSSTAKMDVKGAGQSEVLFSIEQTNSYGPILFTNDGIKFGLIHISADLLPSEEMKKDIPEGVNAEDLFDINILTGFTGGVEGDIYFKGLDFADKDAQINMSPAEFHFVSDAGYQTVKGDASWPGLTVTAEGEDGMTVSGVNLTFDQTLVSGSFVDGTAIYSGAGAYTIDEVVFKDAQQFFKLAKMELGYKSDVQESGEAMDVSMSLKSDLVNVAGEKFTDSSLNIYFNNLDMASMKQLGEISGKMQESALKGENVQGYQMQLMNTMMQLAQNGPNIQVKDTQITTEDGLIKAMLDVNVDKNKVDPANPMSTMMAVDAILEASAPEAFFTKKGMAPMLDQWAQMNYVVKDNGTLKVEATFKNGMPLVNGQPMQGM